MVLGGSDLVRSQTLTLKPPISPLNRQSRTPNYPKNLQHLSFISKSFNSGSSAEELSLSNKPDPPEEDLIIKIFEAKLGKELASEQDSKLLKQLGVLLEREKLLRFKTERYLQQDRKYIGELEKQLELLRPAPPGVEDSPEASLQNSKIKSKSSVKKSNRKMKRSRTRKSIKLSKKNDRKKSNCYNILKQVRSKPQKRLRVVMSQKAVLRGINQIYKELLKEETQGKEKNRISLVSFVYEFYIHSFGFTSIAEPKFTAFLIAVKKHISLFRVNFFAKLLGLLDENYSQDELNRVLDIMRFFNEAPRAQRTKIAPAEKVILQQHSRALEYLKKLSEELKIQENEFLDLKKNLETLREEDQNSFTSTGVVNQEEFFELVLGCYRVHNAKNRQYVKNSFKSLDLFGEEKVAWEDFELLWGLLHPQMKIKTTMKKRFENLGKKDEKGIFYVDFTNFAKLVGEERIFRFGAQLKFIRAEKQSDISERFSSVRKNWEYNQKITQKILKDLLPQSQEPGCVQKWLRAAEQLGAEMESCESNSQIALLVRIRIIEIEVARLSENIEDDEQKQHYALLLPSVKNFNKASVHSSMNLSILDTITDEDESGTRQTGEASVQFWDDRKESDASDEKGKETELSLVEEGCGLRL